MTTFEHIFWTSVFFMGLWAYTGIREKLDLLRIDIEELQILCGVRDAGKGKNDD